MIKQWAVLVLALLFLPVYAHDFHTSLTEVEYNAKAHTYEATIRLFADDAENLLSKLNGGKKFTASNDGPFKAALEKYMAASFKIGKAPGKFIACEQEKDVVYVYLEYAAPAKPLPVKVYNNLLTALFTDQANIVNISINSGRQSHLFNSATVLYTFE